MDSSHYRSAKGIGLGNWIVFSYTYALKAVDFTDLLKEEHIIILYIEVKSHFARISLIVMHWLISILLLTSTSKSWESLNLILDAIKNYILRYAVFGMAPIIALIAVVAIGVGGIRGTCSFLVDINNYIILLDNFIRIIDIGDTFQIYQTQLYSNKLNIFIIILIRIPLIFLVAYVFQIICMNIRVKAKKRATLRKEPRKICPICKKRRLLRHFYQVDNIATKVCALCFKNRPGVELDS
ncbi:hypothetical protein [Candidatus Uabimicrobium sp. HlEnr_7]|uniref:hypothetical protein n=1 Tax=Candidatus Uabimicrobium helgolandensis TaxID=3095367 RepID=UPI0035566A56